MQQGYASHTLYHFVGAEAPSDDSVNFEKLQNILRSMQLWTCAVAKKRGGVTVRIDPERPCVNGEPVEQSVVCFCDIPEAFLGFHAHRYGRFGIGLDRAMLAEWGARPVIYVPKRPSNPTAYNNYLTDELRKAWKGLRDHFPSSPKESSRAIGTPARNRREAAYLAQELIARELLAFIKEFNVELSDTDSENYYLEREWRKFGTLELALPLRTVIAPEEYLERLNLELERHRRLETYLIGPVRLLAFESLPS